MSEHHPKCARVHWPNSLFPCDCARYLAVVLFALKRAALEGPAWSRAVSEPTAREADQQEQIFAQAQAILELQARLRAVEEERDHFQAESLRLATLKLEQIKHWQSVEQRAEHAEAQIRALREAATEYLDANESDQEDFVRINRAALRLHDALTPTPPQEGKDA